MFRAPKAIIALIVAAAIAAAGTFALRGELRDAYARWRRGPVPKAISRDEALRSAGERIAATPPAERPAPTAPKAPAKDAPPVEPAPPEPASPKPSAGLNLEVLFVPQAPHKVWDEIHEDTCEEASMLMLKAYADGTRSMTLDEMDAALLELVSWQKETYGEDGWQSTDAETVVRTMREALGLDGARVVPMASIDDAKAEVAAGRPVIVPAAGKLLGNPNFRNGGPLYHMLVIKGYVGDRIITNDPGTRLGADYVYDAGVLWEAIHDWNGGDVLSGRKVMIVAE